MVFRCCFTAKRNLDWFWCFITSSRLIDKQNWNTISMILFWKIVNQNGYRIRVSSLFNNYGKIVLKLLEMYGLWTCFQMERNEQTNWICFLIELMFLITWFEVIEVEVSIGRVVWIVLCQVILGLSIHFWDTVFKQRMLLNRGPHFWGKC